MNVLVSLGFPETHDRPWEGGSRKPRTGNGLDNLTI